MLNNRKPKPKYLVETKADKQLRQVLISLIASIVLCMGCLVGSTWAWFQTTITSEGNTITIGQMRVSVALDKGEKASRTTVLPSDKYTYELDEVGSYDILLMNAGEIPGYCTIKLTDNQGNTEEFTSGTLYPTEDGLEDAATITITISAEDVYNDVLPVKLEIEPHWGEDPNSAIMDIDEELFLPTEETTEATEETLDDEDPENLQPVEDPSEPTDGSEPTQPPATEETDPPATTEPAVTEPEATDPPETTEATQPPATSEPTETEPQSSSEPTTDPTETTADPTEESKTE